MYAMKHTKTLLRSLRRERDWSLDEVALKTGIDATALSRIERRLRRPSDAQLAKLAQVFSVKRDELVA
jgi:transcriptional regulator with XRE-family HTH domain